VDIGLDLVRTLLACGRTDAADTAHGRLRQLAAGGDPRIDLAEAEVALQLAEFQRAAAAASRARQGAARAQAVALGQRAGRLHAEAMGRLDQRDEARRELESIVKRNLNLGLTGEAAAARLALASVQLRFISKETARRELEAAMTGCRQAGDRRCEIIARTVMAMTAGMEGELAEAIRVVNAAVADARAIGDRWCEGYVLSQLHVLYNWADDTAAIKAMNEPLLAALRDSGNRRLLKIALSNVALVAIDDLELEKAEAYLLEADAVARRIGSQLDTANIDSVRGTLEEARGDFDLARKSYASAIEKTRQAGAKWNLGNELDGLAWLEVAAGRPEAAARHAREAMEAFLSVGDRQMAATTEGALAWSEAKQGDVAAAQRRLAAIRKVLVAGDAEETDRFTFLNTEAYVAAASGDWRRAIELRRRLERMAAEWNAPGLVIRQRVHLAAALHGAGDRRALETLVAELLPEVERHGLRGIARELRALLASPDAGR
jgi:tetratricopeptide (TPR) repeat protein